MQGWLAQPGTAHGWILFGGEGEAATAKRFDSRENPIAANRPVLRVTYEVGSPPAPGSVTGALVVTEGSGTDLTLSCSPSCSAAATDYEVHEGAIGSFYSHGAKLCTTGGATTTPLTPGAGSVYFLVVPRSSSEEGSYGTGRCP